MTESLFADRYRIIRQIGSGGMGVVFAAEDKLLEKTVAIKTIKKGVLTADLVMRFQREANALAALNHPNLVPIFIFGITDDNQPYLVMQYEQGKPLSELIEARGRLPLFKSINIFLQLASAIQHAHEHKVLHRDLKPANVILKNYERESPNVVLIDFGIAMVANNNSMDSLTKTGILLGTPAYMSPEQITGKELDERSDIYSLGCVMYETLTGLQPFTASSALELLALKTSQAAPSINSAYPDLSFPNALEEIIARCLATDPSMRYESMKALKEDLLRFKGGDYAQEAPGSVETATAPAKLSRDAMLVILAGVLIILFGGIIAYSLFGSYAGESNGPSKTSEMPTSIFNMGEESFSVQDGCLNVLGLSGSVKTNDATVSKWIQQHRSKIRAIRLTGVDVDGTCFKNCQDIPITNISALQANFTDEGLEEISKIKSLVTLTIDQADKFTKDGVAKLSNLPALTTVSFKNCNFDDSKTKALCASKQIVWLELQGNPKIDDNAVKMVSQNLPNLRYIDLNDTAVSTEGLESLSKLKHLEQLSVRRVEPTHEAIEAISRMHLSTLDVKSNDSLNIKDIALLVKMPTLRSFDVYSSKVSAASIHELKKGNPDLKINTEPPQATGGRITRELVEDGMGIEKEERARAAASKNSHFFMPEGDADTLIKAQPSIRNKLNVFDIPLHFGDGETAMHLAQEAKKSHPTTTIRAVTLNITGTCFKNCPLPIETLISNGNRLSETGLYNISKLNSLKDLRLKEEFHMGAGLAHLSGASSLENVFISECKFNATSLESLTKSKTLKRLYVRQCSDSTSNRPFLNDEALLALANGGGPNLEELSWIRMDVPGRGTLSALKKLKKLRTLRLNSLGLKKWSVTDLKDLNIENLDLRNNNELAYENLATLEKMKHLKHLTLDTHFDKDEIRRRFPKLAKKTVIEKKSSVRESENEVVNLYF